MFGRAPSGLTIGCRDERVALERELERSLLVGCPGRSPRMDFAVPIVASTWARSSSSSRASAISSASSAISIPARGLPEPVCMRADRLRDAELSPGTVRRPRAQLLRVECDSTESLSPSMPRDVGQQRLCLCGSFVRAILERCGEGLLQRAPLAVVAFEVSVFARLKRSSERPASSPGQSSSASAWSRSAAANEFNANARSPPRGGRPRAGFELGVRLPDARTRSRADRQSTRRLRLVLRTS